ncbi:MAG: molybdenum cofactor guanylyltransferase [Gammaproteobacteria bacterium]|nr:molybdenum cofactor guanylyltransferase [Gammaproteobacteria bacterium]
MILAGGKGSRMNYSDKPLLEIGGRTIIESILDIANRQVGRLIINVNCSHELYNRFNVPIISDSRGDFAGPLAGILSTIYWVTTHVPAAKIIVCFPGDVPWFPGDVVERMLQAMQETGSEVVWLRTDGQVQPLFSVWSITLGPALEDALARGMYSPMQFIRSRRHATVDYHQLAPGFFNNINTPEDLESARGLAEQYAVLSKPAE